MKYILLKKKIILLVVSAILFFILYLFAMIYFVLPYKIMTDCMHIANAYSVSDIEGGNMFVSYDELIKLRLVDMDFNLDENGRTELRTSNKKVRMSGSGPVFDLDYTIKVYDDGELVDTLGQHCVMTFKFKNLHWVVKSIATEN